MNLYLQYRHPSLKRGNLAYVVMGAGEASSDHSGSFWHLGKLESGRSALLPEAISAIKTPLFLDQTEQEV